MVLAGPGPGFDMFAILLKAGDRPGEVVDLEDHLDLDGEIVGPPAGAEYYLDDIARGVALGELGEGGAECLGGGGEAC